MKVILSLSGGGIRGLLSAVWLAELEERIGRPLCESTAMIAGTSTGAIQACCLAAGRFRAEQLIGFYRHHGAGIFRRTWLTPLRYWMGAKYDHAYLESTLQFYLKTVHGGDTLLGQAKTPVLCEAFDLNVKRPVSLSSWETPNLPMWKAARASSAAPTYFRPAITKLNGHSASLIDGGLECNSPAADAYAQLRGQDPDATDIAVISIGTGRRTRYTAHETAQNFHLISWLSEVLAVSMHTERTSNMLAAALKERFVEIDCELVDGASDDMDDASPRNMEALENLARAHIVREPEKFQRAEQMLLSAS